MVLSNPELFAQLWLNMNITSHVTRRRAHTPRVSAGTGYGMGYGTLREALLETGPCGTSSLHWLGPTPTGSVSGFWPKIIHQK